MLNMFRLTLLVIFVISTESADFPSVLYDCSRYDQNCPPSATCEVTTKNCTNCPGGKFGYACHLDSDVVVDQATCKVACENGGSCLEDDTTCQCTPDFTGTLCQTPRILLECGTPNPPDDNSLMKIDVTKIIGFPVSNGQVIVEGADSTMAGDGDCFGKNDGVLEVKNTYAEASKSLACNAADHDSTAQTYTRKFIVRFETGMTSFNTDFRITATCGPEGSTITVTTADIEADRDTAAITNNIDKSNTVAGAHVTAALQVDGTALDTSIGYPLTTNIKVTLTLTLNEGFVAIRLEKMTISNGDTTPKTMDLIDDSCATKDEHVVIKTSPTNSEAHEISMTTSPILMDGTNTNRYTFIIKVCPDGKGEDCKAIPCINNKRRKRAVDDNLATLGVGFKVKDEIQRRVSNEMRNQEECTVSSEITASLVAMAVVILLLLVLVIVLSVRAILARRHDVTVYQHHHLESASTTSLPKLVNGI